jgi:hypothetical protein
VKRHLDDIACDVCGAQSGPMEPTSAAARAWGSAVIERGIQGLRTVDACPECKAGLAAIDEEATRKRRLFIATRSPAHAERAEL